MIRRILKDTLRGVMSALRVRKQDLQDEVPMAHGDEVELASRLDAIRDSASQGEVATAIANLEGLSSQFPAHRLVLATAFDLNFQVGRWSEAGKACRELLERFGPSADLLCAAGLCEIKESRWASAREYMERAVGLDREHLASMHNAGLCALQLGDLQSAMSRLQAAAELDPRHVEVRLNLGVCFKKLRRFDEAEQHFDIARRLAPDEPRVLSEYSEMLLATCSWQALSRSVSALRILVVRQLAQGALPGVSPYTALCLYEDTDLCRRIADAYALSYLRPIEPHDASPRDLDGRRLRLAYLSADFNSHAVGYLFSRFAAFHDRSMVEVFCFYMRSVEDPVTETIRLGVEHFIKVDDVGDTGVADLLRSYQIDVLVDMAGYTAHSRPAILGMRPAPIQCQMLGYPGSMGRGMVDFFVGTSQWIPEHLETSFSERVRKLSLTPVAVEGFGALIAPDRGEFALHSDAFVFVNMSQNYRICERVFGLWMSVLKRCPNSVLWLFGESERSRRNLVSAVERAGVAPERLHFYSGSAKLSDDWRHACADVWLDTLNFSSGTAAALNVWAELPMVTMVGETPQSRTGYALMSGAGLGHYVVDNDDEYVSLACRLYEDRKLLDEFRIALKSAKSTSPLFNPRGFVAELEAVFRDEWSMALSQSRI